MGELHRPLLPLNDQEPRERLVGTRQYAAKRPTAPGPGESWPVCRVNVQRLEGELCRQ